jgi:hypothetical protein
VAQIRPTRFSVLLPPISPTFGVLLFLFLTLPAFLQLASQHGQKSRMYRSVLVACMCVVRCATVVLAVGALWWSGCGLQRVVCSTEQHTRAQVMRGVAIWVVGCCFIAKVQVALSTARYALAR